jgi:hypothetical protein
VASPLASAAGYAEYGTKYDTRPGYVSPEGKWYYDESYYHRSGDAVREAAAVLGLQWISSNTEDGKGTNSFVLPIGGKIDVQYEGSYGSRNVFGGEQVPYRASVPTYTLTLPTRDNGYGVKKLLSSSFEDVMKNYSLPSQVKSADLYGTGAKGTSATSTKENSVFSTGAQKAVSGFRGILTDTNGKIVWESEVVPDKIEKDSSGYDYNSAENAARELATAQRDRIQKAVVALGDAAPAVTA